MNSLSFLAIVVGGRRESESCHDGGRGDTKKIRQTKREEVSGHRKENVIRFGNA